MQSLYLLIPMVLVIIFLFPLKFQLRATFNLESLSGVVCLYIFKIKIKYYHYQIKGKNIILKNEKETKMKEIEFDTAQLIVAEIFREQIKNKARLKELFVFYNLGVGDAFESALLGGLINTAITIMFTTIKNKRTTASMGIYDTISYNREIFEIAGKGSISISLFDVAYSCVMSVILIKNISHQKRRNV